MKLLHHFPRNPQHRSIVFFEKSGMIPGGMGGGRGGTIERGGAGGEDRGERADQLLKVLEEFPDELKDLCPSNIVSVICLCTYSINSILERAETDIQTEFGIRRYNIRRRYPVAVAQAWYGCAKRCLEILEEAYKTPPPDEEDYPPEVIEALYEGGRALLCAGIKGGRVSMDDRTAIRKKAEEMFGDKYPVVFGRKS